VEDIDDSVWAGESYGYIKLGLNPELKLESKSNIQVGGEPAIKRVYSEAYVKNEKKAGTQYVVRVLVVSQRQVYHLYLITLVESKFADYQTLVDQLVGTIQFVP
jgi:hypothetical protein